jgi:hypothetical protein
VPLTVIIRGRHVLIGPSLIGARYAGACGGAHVAGAFSSVRSFNTGLGIRSSSGTTERDLSNRSSRYRLAVIAVRRAVEQRISSENQIDARSNIQNTVIWRRTGAARCGS